MRPVIRAAPAGIESFWMVDPHDPDLLAIHVNGDLDQVARQRYIDQAKAEFGIDHERFTYKYQGLEQKLTGVEKATVVKSLLT